MAKKDAVKGFVVESELRGHFYHRSGCWVRYASPAVAYVWSPGEVVGILKASARGWEHKPVLAHPAIHDSRSGITILTGSAVAVDTVRGTALKIPDSGGVLFNLKVASELGSNNIVAMSVSL